MSKSKKMFSREDTIRKEKLLIFWKQNVLDGVPLPEIKYFLIRFCKYLTVLFCIFKKKWVRDCPLKVTAILRNSLTKM